MKSHLQIKAKEVEMNALEHRLMKAREDSVQQTLKVNLTPAG
jgi:hypothetical protein